MLSKFSYLLLALGLGLPCLGAAAPRVACDASYGEEHVLTQTAAAGNPYQAQAYALSRHFMFKPVVVGAGERVDYVNIYSYYLYQGRFVLFGYSHYAGQDLHPGDNFTGQVHLYSPRLGREMQYQCRYLGA